MGSNLLQTKHRINSVFSTSKITNAMELVATSKLKKAKDLNESLAIFNNEIIKVMNYCISNIDDRKYHYFVENETSKKLVIVVTSSLGLCGGYNINTFKYVLSNVDKESDLIVFGLKGRIYFKQKGYNVIEYFDELPSFNLKENMTSSIGKKIIEMYNKKEYKSVEMVYSKFVNSLTFEPTKVKLLPLTIINDKSKMSKELVFEPSSHKILDSLIPFCLAKTIKSYLFESMLSEQASRRVAMEAATDNANELLDKLKLEYNKARQASITQEITEISASSNN